MRKWKTLQLKISRLLNFFNETYFHNYLTLTIFKISRKFLKFPQSFPNIFIKIFSNEDILKPRWEKSQRNNDIVVVQKAFTQKDFHLGMSNKSFVLISLYVTHYCIISNYTFSLSPTIEIFRILNFCNWKDWKFQDCWTFPGENLSEWKPFVPQQSRYFFTISLIEVSVCFRLKKF